MCSVCLEFPIYRLWYISLFCGCGGCFLSEFLFFGGSLSYHLKQSNIRSHHWQSTSSPHSLPSFVLHLILNANHKKFSELLFSLSVCFSFMWNFNDSRLVYDFGHSSHQNFFGLPHSRLRWRVSDEASLYDRPHPLMHEKDFSFGVSTGFKSLLLHLLGITTIGSNFFGSGKRPLSRKCSEKSVYCRVGFKTIILKGFLHQTFFFPTVWCVLVRKQKPKGLLC